MIQIKACGKYEIEVLTPQKLCRKKTPEVVVWNIYSVLLHECLCGHIEFALYTVMQISRETEHC